MSMTALFPDVALRAEELAFLTPPVRHARIAALVVERDRIIGRGQCMLKSHPFQARWGNNEESIFWHAETRAIWSTGRDNLKGCDIYICRAYNNTTITESNLAIAYPCAGCERAIRYYGIRFIHYTDDDGLWATAMPIEEREAS